MIMIITATTTTTTPATTVGFHNFNLRIFNLSLKSEQIHCGCFC